MSDSEQEFDEQQAVLTINALVLKAGGTSDSEVAAEWAAAANSTAQAIKYIADSKLIKEHLEDAS